MQDIPVFSTSTKPTKSTEKLSTSSPILEPGGESDWLVSEPTTTIWSKTQHTTTESLNGLEFTQQETISEQTQFVTTNDTSGTTNRALESVTSSNVVLGTSRESPKEIASATDTVTRLLGPVAHSSNVSTLSAFTETTESPNRLLEADTIVTTDSPNRLLEADIIVTTESQTLPTEQVAVTDEVSFDTETTVPNSAEISPDITNLSGITSSTTEFPSFSFTTFPSSLTPYVPHYHCTESGHFAARPSCVEYHVCRHVGFWLVHFKATCYFGHQFSLRFRLCVPSYLSDCNTDPHLVDYHP
jgi:hypothetical protein